MPVARNGDADIHYEVSGSGDPLLLIMGFSADSRGWMAQQPAFAERYRVITFDNRGAGQSSLTPGPYDMALMTDDALAVMDAAGLERAHVVGISMGGAIAQHLALRAPERVRSLTLACTWARQNGYTERIASVGRAVAEGLGLDMLVHASLLWLFTPKFLIEQHANIEMMRAMFLSFVPPIDTFVNQLHGVLEHDVLHRLGEITAPTRSIVAKRDMMVPPELGRDVAAAIPGSELVELESGHACNIEEAEAFNAAVLEFIARH